MDRGEGYRGVHKEEESSIMHKQRLGWSHAHTCTHTQYIPLYCYSYSLSYNRPNKEMNTIFRMLLKIDLTRVQYLCSKY